MSNNKKKKPSVADLAKVTKATSNYKQEAAKGKGVQAAPMYVGNKPTSEIATQKRNEAMQTKEWQRIDNITKERENRRLAAMEKAQKERAEAEKKKRYGTEYELVKKVASGEADEVDKISYNYYKRVRERETNNTLYYLNKSIDDFAKGYNSLGGKNYVSADEYDKIAKNAENINESINRAIEYYELYGSDNDIKEFEKLRDNFSNIMLESNRNKKIMSQFKNENEYNAAREANGVASYAELRQKRDYLQRQKGNGNAADIDAKLNALDKYGLNSNVIKSMSAEDWEHEKERISVALGSAQRENDRYNSTAYINAHYEEAVNKRGLSEDSARDELQSIIKNSSDKVKYYSDLLNEMTELARMSQAQKDIDAKWGIYASHSQFDSNSVPRLKKGTSGDVDYDAINYGVVPDAIRTEHGTPENDDAIKRAKKLANNISDEEKRMYNFVYNTYGAEKAEQYLKSIEVMLNKRHTLSEQKKAFEQGQEKPWQSAIYNRLISPLRTAEGLINNVVNVGTTFAGGEIDPYADRFMSSNLSPVLDEGVKTNIDSRVGKFIYSAATQAAELALNMAMAKGIGGFAGKAAGSANANLIANKVANVANQVLLSSNSMLSTTLGYKKSGASDLAALGMGMISGAIEAWTERKSLSNLLKSPDIFNEAKAMAKLGKWTKKIGVDAAKEGWEEIEANLYNTLAAFIFEQRNNDSFLLAYDEAIKNGHAENKAFWEAVKAVSPEYLESFAVGALAGGMFGAANTASGVHTYNQVRDDASAFFEDKGYTKSSVMEYLIKNGVSEDTEIARLSDAIVHKANGQMIDDSEIKESPFLSGVLMSYVEGMNTGEITDKTDVKQSVKKEKSTLTSFPVSDVGRTGTAVHNELSEYVVSNLMQDGMSQEDARRTAESMFELMYKSGKYGVKKEEALTSGAELYSEKYTDYMSAFYSAGVTDANNQVLGKKTAMLIKTDALYQLRKEKSFSRKAERVLNAIASKLGVDIEIVKELPDGDNAVWNETTGRLLISAKSKNPIVTAAVHDGVHAIRSIDSEAYNSLAALTVEILGKDSVVLDNAMSERLKVYKEEATGEDGKINPDYITEEMVAEVLSHTLNLDESFINEMAASDRNLVQRIFDAIGDFFERLFKRYTGEKQSDMSPEIKEAVDMLRAESEKIKSVLGKALEVTKNKQRTTMKLPKSGKVMHSNSQNNDIEKNSETVYNKNTDQYRVMWTLEEGVLSKGEVSAFYAKISEMKKQRYPNYKLSKDGEYIFEVGNKLIYSDGDYDYPEITRVVAFNTDNNYLIEYGRETIYDGNEYGIALQDALEIVKAVYGEEITTVSDFGDSKAYAREWENRRRKRENSRASDSRSGENVRKSKVSEIDSTSEDLPKISATVLPAINLDEKTQAKLNELIKKYGGMESGFNPARNVIVPEKTSDDNYVRRFARTAVESDKVNDEAAVQIMKDIADGEFWTTYERVGNKKTQEAAKVKLEQDGFEKMLREWEATLESGKKLEKQDIVNAQLLLEVAADNGNTELVVRLVSEIAAEATRAGQVVQSMLLLKRLGTAANVYKVERVVSELQRDLIRQRGKKAPKLEIPGELLEEYAEAFDREVKEGSHDHSESDRVAAEIYKAVAGQISSTWIDKLTAWRYLAMLGNPRTHIRNMVGNLAFAPAIMMKNVIATTGETLFIRNVEKRTKSFSGLFSKGSEYQYAKADADAISAVLRGDGKYGDTDLITQHQQVFKTKWLDSLRKFNTNLLEKEDWLFLKPHYARALTMYMKAHKLSGEDITAEQLDKARKIAIQEAKKATFRDASAFASWLSLGKKTHPVVGMGVDAVLPFKKTPINVLKRGVEYSPLGILKPVAKGLFKVGEGKYTAAELIDDLSASLSGSGLMVLGLWLASSGILKGRGSDDEEENILQTLGGMQNYSLKIGNGTYTIDWLAPSAMALFVGCEMYNAFKEGGMTFADIMEALPRITEPVFEMSMLESLSSLVERASYEETSSAKLGAIVADLPASYLGQFVPTLLGQTARTIDPTRRKIYIDKDSKVPDWIQSFVQQQAKKIPVVSFMMEPYVNARGEQELNAEGNVFSRAFQNFLSPGYYKKMRSTAVDDEMARLYAELGESAGGIMPKTVQKYITMNGERVNLSAEQYSEYQRTTGQSYYKKLGEIISSDYYKALTDEQKIDLLEKAKNYSVEVGKNAALPEYKITNGWLKTAFETDGGFQYILDLDKKESFSEKDLQGESFDKYESDRDTMFDSIISNYKPNDSDYALADKYYDNLYSFTHRVALERNANGKYAIDTKWMKTAKNLNPKDQAEFIYGTTALSLKDFKEYKDALGNTISRKQQVCEYIGRLNISNRIKSYLFREEYKDRTSKGKSNIAEVTWRYEWLQ